MMNPAGSGSSACVSVTPDAEVRARVERFLQIIEWRGMFMIELLRDQQGRLWFMELNGRSWGSMALARRMGFEYPGWAVRGIIDPAFVPPAPRQAPTVLCRHLGGELLHVVFVWRGPRSRAFFRWPSRVAALRAVLRVGKNDAWYSYNRNDPKVFWSDTWGSIASRIRTRRAVNGSRSFVRRVMHRLKRPIVRYKQAGLRSSGAVAARLDTCEHLLFVCYGNINRSALAEQHLRQLLGPAIEISSCGFHREDGRPLDPIMRTLAADSGIHVGTWASRTIDRQRVARADLILAMEADHLLRLFSEYPESRGRAFLLGGVTSPNKMPLEIADPFGRPPEDYQRCIREVTCATSAIAERVSASRRAGPPES
jgi:protein-tyrosine-phosphatase